MLISIETHNITCDFPGGGGGSGRPILPLDPHMNMKISTMRNEYDVKTQDNLCRKHYA